MGVGVFYSIPFFKISLPSLEGEQFACFTKFNGVAPITQFTHVRNKNRNIQGRSLNVISML